MESSNSALITFILVMNVFMLAVFALVFSVFAPWLRLRNAGARVPFTQLIAMRFRRTLERPLIDAAIRLTREANEPTRLLDIECHYLAGGRVDQLLDLYLVLKTSRVEDAWNKAAAFDLMGKHHQPPRSALEMAHEKLDWVVRK